jgi:hypothetical protein
MNKGPDYERIRAMLSGKQGLPQLAEEEEEQSWIGHYLGLAEKLILGRFRQGDRRLLHFPPWSSGERRTSEKPPAKRRKEDEAA